MCMCLCVRVCACLRLLENVRERSSGRALPQCCTAVNRLPRSAQNASLLCGFCCCCCYFLFLLLLLLIFFGRIRAFGHLVVCSLHLRQRLIFSLPLPLPLQLVKIFSMKLLCCVHKQQNRLALGAAHLGPLRCGKQQVSSRSQRFQHVYLSDTIQAAVDGRCRCCCRCCKSINQLY